MKYLLLIISIAALIQTGCYYDKHDLLYTDNSCDTTNFTFSGTVVPVLNANCTGCHSGINAPNGVRLDSWATTKPVAASGLLLNVILHTPGFAQMPKNGR